MANEREDHSCVKIGKGKSLININKKPKIAKGSKVSSSSLDHLGRGLLLLVGAVALERQDEGEVRGVEGEGRDGAAQDGGQRDAGSGEAAAAAAASPVSGVRAAAAVGQVGGAVAAVEQADCAGEKQFKARNRGHTDCQGGLTLDASAAQFQHPGVEVDAVLRSHVVVPDVPAMIVTMIMDETEAYHRTFSLYLVWQEDIQ